MVLSPACNFSLTFLFVLGLVLFARTEANTFDAVMVHITSGDTLTFQKDGARIRCHLAFADAPESDQPYGSTAKQSLGTLIFNRAVRIEGIDAQSMLVRIKIGNLQIDETLLSRGLAWVSPRTAHNRHVTQIQHRAKTSGRGLWRNVSAIAPWRWRMGVRTP